MTKASYQSTVSRLVLAVFAATSVQRVEAANLLAMGRSGDNSTLLRITTNPFAVTPIGTTTLGRLSGLCTDPTSGRLYACSTRTGRNTDCLFRVNPSTGAATLIGKIGTQRGGAADLAIDRNGIIYATDGTTLYTVDPSTGAGTLVGAFGSRPGEFDIRSIGVDPRTNMIHGLDFGNGNFYLIDRSNADATSLGTYATPGGNWTGCGYDNDGTRYGCTGRGSGDIYRLNEAFSSSFIGDYDDSISDITSDTDGDDCPLEFAVLRTLLPQSVSQSLEAAGRATMLAVARGFRDKVLRRTERGRELITVYYRHRDELKSILRSDPVLMTATVQELLIALPTLREAIQEQELNVSRTTLARINVLLERYRKVASRELRTDLDKADSFLRKSHQPPQAVTFATTKNVVK